MTFQPDRSLVYMGPQDSGHRPLGFGGWSFGPDQWTGQEDAHLLSAMQSALDHHITHFDTAAGYGDGYSERLIGRFLAADERRRKQVFLATKFASDDLSARAMLDAVDASLERLQTDWIDLFYIHWPRTGRDLRPWMEGLESARQQGKIRAIGVSNFSVAQMAQIAEVGRIDAHQLLYNLLWRFNEREIIPYCREHDIAIVTYSSIAHGILGGRYTRDLKLVAGDQRQKILLFRDDVWPKVYEATEAFKRVAEQAGRPLIHLAVRWLLRQPGVTSVLVGARNAQQAEANAQSLEGMIEDR
ncbi:MAG: aldo/keto reductase, partial [Anaerolineae bacterium]|nr:aldo/keto reductase [Anaerolineae bacterium]